MNGKPIALFPTHNTSSPYIPATTQRNATNRSSQKKEWRQGLENKWKFTTMLQLHETSTTTLTYSHHGSSSPKLRVTIAFQEYGTSSTTLNYLHIGCSRLKRREPYRTTPARVSDDSRLHIRGLIESVTTINYGHHPCLSPN